MAVRVSEEQALSEMLLIVAIAPSLLRAVSPLMLSQLFMNP